MPAYRILIADDHPLMRAALRQAVAQTLPDAELIEAGGFSQVMETTAARHDGIDLILLDLHMPGMNGFIGLFLLRGEHPAIPIIVVSALEDTVTIQRSLEYGASGFVPKSAPIETIAKALHTVLDGGDWFPEMEGASPPVANPPEPGFADRIASLTPQQLRVLAGITSGKLNKQIAYEMSVSEATVKAHVTVILRKLGLHSRTQVIIAAGRLVVEAPGDEAPGPSARRVS
ncbi:LuxR family transcriptional regulator [Skermanella stibiiresistens SB22]|uniref:LuxR family transcriptional regulator n=1 Tax=Skermanella stibiiresistens SB22 TaxID=1385369 RepID=W9HE61_9PROT|nr:response regulator transcription factor [Skermanella stibiiresistens]EWY42158.1 LuxR family transcriptional regulator [Skermanella stibiiresistens SB22]